MTGARDLQSAMADHLAVVEALFFLYIVGLPGSPPVFALNNGLALTPPSTFLKIRVLEVAYTLLS